MTGKFLKITYLISLIFLFTIFFSNQSFAYDTVGVTVNPYNFYQENITEISWKADISEFEFNTYPNTSVIPLRIEYNTVAFMGSDGQLSMGDMIQNLLHEYDEASCGNVSMAGGLELYFSVIDDLGNDIVPGLKLDANPDNFPRFRRIYQDIDGSGIVGNNIYSNDAIAVISDPVTVEWHLKRGNLVNNPVGNLHKNINCNWESLQGDYREWKVDVTINAVNYAVATYYLPEGYASYLRKYGPLTLHQEHFGACGSRLNVSKARVEYYDFQILTESSSEPVTIPNWKITWKIDDECGNQDSRYGVGTVVKNNMKRLVTSVGHEDDIYLKREVGFTFEDINMDLPPQITITSPQNTTIPDTTPDLNLTTDELAKITYSWNSEGNISGCRNCTSFNTTYGEAVPEVDSAFLVHFNENFGNTTYDDSSNGNNGTLGNATAGTQPAWAAGKFGNALEFDGTDDYVNITDDPSLKISDNMTIVAWIKPNIGAWQTVIRKGQNTQLNYRIDMSGAGYMNFAFDSIDYGYKWVTSSIAVEDGAWSHIVGRYNGTTMKIYINGVDRGTTSVSGSIRTGTQDLTIGRDIDQDNWFNGSIDEVAIYNRSLSATEIQELYNKSLSYGSHCVTVYANDSAGNLNSTKRCFTVVTVIPTITINSPANDTITDNTPDLNLTTDELANITYSWDGEGNITGCRNCTSYSTTYGENNGSDPNTVLLMHMNENYGTTAYDDASNNDGAISGATWSVGRFGSALDFDGTSDYVQVADNDSIDFNASTDSFTIMAWIKSIGATGTSQYIVNKQSGGFNPGYHLFLKNNGKLRFMIHTTAGNSDFGSIVGTTNLIGTGWHHVTAVYDASADTMDIYVDGNGDKATTSYTPTASSLNDEPLFIGANDGANENFNGSIDEFVIYNRSLTKSEIQDIYSKILPVGRHSVTVYANDTAGNLNSTTRWFSVSLNINITSPPNATITDTTPDLNLTISELANTIYNWNNEGNITGCQNCTSYSTTYGEYANASEQNLVLAMHFNENNSNTTYDDSGMGNNGTIFDAAWTAGKFGPALDFDGSGDYVRVPDNDSLDFSLTDDFTMMVWFKTSGGSGSRYIFDKSWSSEAQYRAYHLFMTSGKLRFMIHANGTGTGANTSNIKSNDLYNDSQWHHIAIVRNTSADKVFMYIDGAYKKNAAAITL